MPDPCDEQENASGDRARCRDCGCRVVRDRVRCGAHSGFPSGSGSWSLSENPSWISIASDGVVTWRPSGAPDATYGYTVEYTRGGCSDSDSSSVTVTRFTP